MKKQKRQRNPVTGFIDEIRKDVKQREKELAEIRNKKRNKNREIER